jgi:DNA-binding MarR family transcriptional regulator
MTAEGRTANVLGALALVVSDRAAAAVTDATGQSTSAAAALSALSEFLDRPTLDDLRKVLGLTPSGVVRLVDRLVDAGLVTREAGADARSRAIVLTEEGRRLATKMSRVRMETLAGALDGLTERELDDFHRVLSRVMANVVQAKDGGAWICRMCDLAACERSGGRCPAALAAREKYG